MKTSQRGFIVPLLLIIIFVIAGIFVYKHNKTDITKDADRELVDSFKEKAKKETSPAKINHAINRELSTALYLFKLGARGDKYRGTITTYANLCNGIQEYTKNYIVKTIRDFGEDSYDAAMGITIDTYTPSISKIVCKSTVDKFVASVPITPETGGESYVCVDASESSTSKIGAGTGTPDYSTYNCK